jgi:YD repeat-containing protein
MGRNATPARLSGRALRIGTLAGAAAVGLCLPHPAAALQGPAPGAAAASTIKVPDGPGSVRGLADPATVEVFTGQVGYQIPIDLPTGRAGFGPTLALHYNGALGNGPLGIGWAIDSVMIRRSDRLGVPAYDASDELELSGVGGGGRLVRDPNKTNPQQYWVEGKGTSIRVVQRNGRFEVTDANGTRYFLGNSSASREEQDGRVAAWMVDWIVDLGSNQIEFAYLKASNRLYLASMVWGPVQGSAPVFRAEVEYEARSDKVVSYRTGFPITTASRVKAIHVTAFGGQRLRDYSLEYEEAFALTRLRRVTMTGRDGVTALPSVSFDYVRANRPELVTFAGTEHWELNHRGVAAVDVDGDGQADLLRLEAGNHQYLQGRGNYFGSPKPLTGASDVDLDGSTIIDLDGDARPELVRVVDDTWRVYRLVDGNWERLGEWGGTRGVGLRAPDAVLADLNGDGRIDTIQPRGSGVTVRFGGASGLGPGIARPALSEGNVGVEVGRPEVRFVDMNGDGLADVVWLTDAWMKIFLGRGDGTFVPFSRTPYPWGGSAAVDLSNLLIADLNRDGLVDLVRVDAANVTWFRGEADGRFGQFFRHLARPPGADADVVVTIADLNGNGSQDVVWSSSGGLWALDLAGPTSAGMLRQIDNGLGMKSTFSYDASGTLAVAADRSGVPWQVLLPVSIPVPVSVETDPGAGGVHRLVQHTVRDGFWDGLERRFGGFLLGRTTRVAVPVADSQIEETRYLAGLGADRELRGKPWHVQTANGTGGIFSVARSSWQAIKIAVLPDSPLLRKPGLLTSQLFLYEGVAQPVEIRTTYELDAEVRTTAEHHFGRVDAPGDEKVVRRAFASDDALWVRDRLCQETVREGDDATVASDVRHFYGGDGAGTPNCVDGALGKGWLRLTQGWLAYSMVESRWVDQSASSYDSFGNQISSTVQGVTRTIGFDAQRLFPVSETIVGTAQALTWLASWDPVLGRIATVTDPNLDVTTIAYDVLARPSTVKVNARDPHIRYGYDWSPPLPKTTTSVFDGDAAALASEGPTFPAGVHWRHTTSVANGAGEGLYSFTPLGTQFIVSGWQERDERAQLVRTAEPFYSPTSAPTASPVSARAQVTDYDAQGRVRTQTFPNGGVKTIVYGALRQVVTNPELGPVTSDSDGLLRVIATQRNASGTVAETVSAKYDAADRITRMILQGGDATHTFDYDTLGRLRHAFDPDIGNRTLVYDDRNLLIQHTNGEQQSVYFDYDAASRLIRRGETAAPNIATDYVYTYDDASAALGPGCQILSRLASVREPAGDVHFCYDELGRQVGMTRTITVPDAAPATGSKAQGLGFSGLVLSETFDDGFATAYQYDAAGRAISVSSAGAALWTADQIDAAGRVTQEHYGNGATQAYAYDNLGLTQHVTVASPSGPPTLYDVTVERTLFGAPKLVVDNDGTGLDHNATFGYDLGGRLTSSTLGTAGSQQFQFSYAYDALQNMRFRGVTGPQDIGVLAGTYRYGERGYGPRQLTSVVPGGGP